jgi:hypothetical protein
MEDRTIQKCKAVFGVSNVNASDLIRPIQRVGCLDKKAFSSSIHPADLLYKETIFNCMLQVDAWASSYLSKPHKDIGRSGPVCPFVPQAIKKKTLLMTYCLCHEHTTSHDIQAAMLQKKAYFHQCVALESQNSQYDALITVFVHVNGQTAQLNKMIEHTQHMVKPLFIKDKLMVGQFFEGCQAEGLHNASFRPFNAPVPVLGIRKLMPQDLVFLTDKPEHMQIYMDVFQIKSKGALMNLLKSVCFHKNKRVLAHADVLLKQCNLLVCEA